MITRKAKSESLNVVGSLETYVKDLSKTFPDMNLQDHVPLQALHQEVMVLKQKRKTIYPVHWSAERLKREVPRKRHFEARTDKISTTETKVE